MRIGRRPFGDKISKHLHSLNKTNSHMLLMFWYSLAGLLVFLSNIFALYWRIRHRLFCTINKFEFRTHTIALINRVVGCTCSPVDVSPKSRQPSIGWKNSIWWRILVNNMYQITWHTHTPHLRHIHFEVKNRKQTLKYLSELRKSS